MGPKKKVSDEKIQARIREWESAYGKIPTDATHIDMVGAVYRMDVKKIEGTRIEYWNSDKWCLCSMPAKNLNRESFFARFARLPQVPSAVEAISEPHPRIAEWKAKYGEIPSGATHLFLLGSPVDSDLKRVKRDGTVLCWEIGGKWTKSDWSLKDIQAKPHLFVKLRPAATDHEQPVEIKHPRIIEWEAEFGSLPEGITHLHTGEHLNPSNAKKVRPDGVVCYWDGKWWARSYWKPKEIEQKIEDFVVIKPEPSEGTKMEDEKLCRAIDAWIKKHGALPEGTTHFVSLVNSLTGPYLVGGEVKYWSPSREEWVFSSSRLKDERIKPLPLKYLPETKPGPDPEPKTTVKTIWYNGAKEPFSYIRLAEIIMENDYSNLEFSVPAPDHFGTGDPVMTVITEYLKRPVECCYFLYGKVHSGEIKIRRTTKLAPAPKTKADDFGVKNLVSVSVLCWVAGNWREMPGVNERIFEWVKCYGKVPEDATHFFTGGNLARSDIKKHKDGYVWSLGHKGWWQKCFAFEGDFALHDPCLFRINAEDIRYITKEHQDRKAEPPITAADWVAESEGFINEPMHEILPKPVKVAHEPKPKVFPIAAMADQSFPCQLGGGYGS